MSKTGHEDKKEAVTAVIERVVHDQGGGATCGNCNEYLGCNPMKEPEHCPGCGRKLIKSGNSPFINPGGSDF